MSKSRARLLAELLNSSGLVKKSKSALSGADEVIDLSALPTITNAKLENASITIADHVTALGGSVTLNTGDIGEHTNYKYYTDARADARIVNAGSANWNTAYGWGNHSGVYLPIGSKAADSNLLDGIDSTGFVKQLGNSTSGPNYFTPSSRRVDPNAANPTNAHYAISTFGNGGNVTGQLATHFQSGQAYTRGYNSSWSAWRTQWDSLNDGSGSGLDADLLDGQHGSYYYSSANPPPTYSKYLRADVSDVYNGRVLSFGTAGNGTNTSGAFLTIEGNTDSSGEGSGRLFFREHNSSTAAADNYGMSLGYRGGADSVTTARGNTWTGLTAIGNGEWGMWGHDGSQTGVLAMHGPRTGAYVDFNNAKIAGNQVWHAGNDGSSSGLDADLLDG
ncbi:MAG TPA: hypothetical protein DCW83_04300, partial [Saprospirales bacterium]|nr:hypothetical protein [Saprospirales bacterium]